MTHDSRGYVPMGRTPRGQRGLCAALALFAPLLIVWSAVADPRPDDLDEPLPADPLLWSSDLESGLRYAIRPVAQPRGQVLLRLVVRAGSLYETDGQEGAAHLTSQTLFATALRRDAGRAISEIPGALANLNYRTRPANVDFESASFTVRIPSNDSGTLTTALRFLADIAQGRALADDAMIEVVQPEIVEFEQARDSAGARMRQQLFQKLFAGTRMARHLPFCPIDELCQLSPEALRQFHEAHYRPSEMALVIVGDADLDVVEPLIAQEFGVLLPQAPPQALVPVAPPERRGGALIVTDRELTAAIAEISFVDAFEGGTATRGDLRRRLMQQVLATALTQRLRHRQELGEAAYLDSEAWIGAASGPIEIAVASVEGEPARWSAMFEQLAGDVASVSVHGLSEREFAEVRETIIAKFQRNAENAAGTDSSILLHELAEAELTDSVVLAPIDHLEVARELLMQLDIDAINSMASRRLNLRQASLVLLLPEDAPAPEPADLSRVAARAFTRAQPRERESQPLPTIITRRPEAGQVLAIDIDPPSGLSSAWLSSGARVHHVKLDRKPDQLAMVITIAGGRIQEDEKTRGLTMAASSIFKSPATSTRSAIDIRRALVGQTLRMRAHVEDDRLVLHMDFSRADLEAAFQLAHVLLTDPVLEGATLESWRWKYARQLKHRARMPAGRAIDLLAQVRRPRGDEHEEPLTGRELDLITRQRAQKWLEKITREAPIEIAIVGDVSRAEAFELAALYLGSISPRSRISPAAFCERRLPGRPAPGTTITESIETTSSEAALLFAIPGADESELRDTLLLDLAARILGNRIDVAAAQRRQLAFKVVTEHAPGVAFPDSGLLLTFARTDPNLIDPLLEVIEGIYTDLGRHGPSQGELDLVMNQLRSDLTQRQFSPAAWAERIATLEYRGADVSDLLRARDLVSSFTTEDVREVLAEYDPGPKRRLKLIVRPEVPEVDQAAVPRP